MSTDEGLVIYSIRDATIVTFNDASVLDTLKIQQIGEKLYHLVEQRHCKKLVLDFDKVEFLSSSALGMLITLRQKAEAIKGRVAICALQGNIKKAFKITRLDKLFDFYDDEQAALASFGISTAG